MILNKYKILDKKAAEQIADVIMLFAWPNLRYSYEFIISIKHIFW